MSLLIKAEQTLDAVYIQVKETIKAQKDCIAQDIERVKRDEEMDEGEKKWCHNVYLEDYKSLMKSIQEVTKSIKRGKGEIEQRDERRKEKETKEMCQAVIDKDVKRVKSFIKRGIANVDWQNQEIVRLCFYPFF